MSFNPNAKEWKPNVSAASWTPKFAAPAPVPTPEPEQPAVDDPNDPLWIEVLKIAGGDVTKANRMLDDPDSLMKYPSIEAIMNSMDVSTEEVEDELVQVTEEKLAVNDTDITAAVKPPTTAEPAEAMEEEDEDDDNNDQNDNVVVGDPREHVNLVFIGHVDAGKSTLSGNILYITENVDKRTIERYEREAKELNRESWFLAFIMDTNDEERAKGKTVEVGRAEFDTETKRYTILDAPGHKNYVPNMIMGASQADIGVLVISARKGEFETGFEKGGQTREHAMLAKTLGVSYLVVVINKMDEPTVQWKKERFDECVTKLKPFLKGCGYKIKKEVKFIPISGLAGDNIKNEVDPSVCSWWKDMYTSGENNTTQSTLIGLLDSLNFPDRRATAPLRIPVIERYSDRGTIAMGKVESGTIRAGMKVTLMPTRTVHKVTEVCAGETPVDAARPGENVLVKLNNCSTDECQKGFVICTEPKCRAVEKMICHLAILDMPENTPILSAGFNAMFHCHCAEEECTIIKLFETTDKKGVVNKNPAYASLGMRVVCMIEVTRSVPVDTYDDYPFLGRFTLRTEGKTIGIGKITKLPPKKD